MLYEIRFNHAGNTIQMTLTYERSRYDRLFFIWLSCLPSLTIFFSQHYLDLDMSKYEAHLYSNVEELGAAMETRGLSDEVVTMPTEQQDSRL